MRWWHAVCSSLHTSTWVRSTPAIGSGPPVDGSALEALATSARGGRPGRLPVAQTAPHLQVLVVDDSPLNLQDTGDLLSQWGIVPATACNGEEALTLASERQFDIILMDVAMPVMDGLEATRRIRQLEIEQPERPHTPIVAYTTGWLLADAVLLARVGFDEAIKKPCGADQMRACLRRWGLTTPVLLS